MTATGLKDDRITNLSLRLVDDLVDVLVSFTLPSVEFNTDDNEDYQPQASQDYQHDLPRLHI